MSLDWRETTQSLFNVSRPNLPSLVNGTPTHQLGQHAPGGDRRRTALSFKGRLPDATLLHPNPDRHDVSADWVFIVALAAGIRDRTSVSRTGDVISKLI